MLLTPSLYNVVVYVALNFYFLSDNLSINFVHTFKRWVNYFLLINRINYTASISKS